MESVGHLAHKMSVVVNMTTGQPERVECECGAVWVLVTR